MRGFFGGPSVAVANPANHLQPLSATQTNSGTGESVMHQVVVTFLAAVFAVAETLGIHLHYIMRVPTADINPTSYPFVWVATTVIALDIFFNLLSAAAGQSERKLWWLDLFTTLGRLFFVVGAWVATVLFWQGPVPASPRDVPIELWVLVGLTAWALLDLRLQWYKKKDVMAHVAVARAVHITPPAQTATIPAPTATQPQSGTGGTAVTLLLVFLAALILGFVLWGDKGRYRTDVGSTGFGSYGPGWKTDIEPPPPLGHEWRDVTRR